MGIGRIISIAGLLQVFVVETMRGLYIHSLVTLYCLFCVALHDMFIEKGITKDNVLETIVWITAELAFGVILCFAAYKEAGGVLLFAMLLISGFYGAQAVVKIIRFFRNEKQ